MNVALFDIGYGDFKSSSSDLKRAIIELGKGDPSSRPGGASQPSEMPELTKQEQRLLAAFRKVPEGEQPAVLNWVMKVAAGEMTARVIEDTRLGRLQARYEKRLREIELPEGGFKTKEQFDAAHRLSTTLQDLQKVRAELGLPAAKKPEKVKKAEAMWSAYYASHDKTGAPIARRPRGRPPRKEPNPRAFRHRLNPIRKFCLGFSPTRR